MTGTVVTPEGSDFTVREVPFDRPDPYANARLAEIGQEIALLEATAAQFYGTDAGHGRTRRSRIDHTNPATRAILDRLPASAAWLATVPTAAALHPLYHPEDPALPSGTPIDAETRDWFRNIADARGIRSRAAVMQDVLTREATGAAPGRWLSLACGAAQPVFHTLESLAAAGGPVPHVTLADLDQNALRLATTYAAAHGLTEHTHPVRTNVLTRDGFARLPRPVPGLTRPSGWLETFDAVDAVGILEYLKPEDWTYTYRGILTTRRVLAGAVTFLRNAFACVKPGGLLLVGNMLTSHPQLGFTLNVIQWPHIQPRSSDDMLALFAAAGLRGHLDIHRPDDGVYAVYVIRKPLS
ncbi:class I SAM-dependent methyltransferase [Granulicoccus phenolivorans]|uniref:class I SAM-dependent methyltransferase n=1 Tax=Granulicoccus phenolivorans TaxID=266854 RepID=UPI00047ECA38|nr:class I SAM-dependent methyltransferase [Granulicoccus phenolivorans]